MATAVIIFSIAAMTAIIGGASIIRLAWRASKAGVLVAGIRRLERQDVGNSWFQAVVYFYLVVGIVTVVGGAGLGIVIIWLTMRP